MCDVWSISARINVAIERMSLKYYTIGLRVARQNRAGPSEPGPSDYVSLIHTAINCGPTARPSIESRF